MASEIGLPVEERKARITALLRQVDEAVRREDFNEALEKIRKVYEFDLKNMYARAFEERILVMMLEKDRKEIEKQAEKKVVELADLEVKRRIRDFYRTQEVQAQAQKKQERIETELEEQARSASVIEKQTLAQRDISTIEYEMKSRINELEQRLAEQMRQTLDLERRRLELESRQRVGEIRLAVDPRGQVVTNPGEDQPIELLKIEYEAKLLRIKEQLEQETVQRLEEERSAIREETIYKLKDEHSKNVEELVQRLEEERRGIIQREDLRMRENAVKVYQTLVGLAIQLKLSKEIEDAILEPLRITFNLDHEDEANARKTAHIASFVDALRSAWGRGRPSPEDLGQIENLRILFGIPDEEHNQILRRVKKELGLPDENAIVLVIDDDPRIIRFVEHILRKTYKTVLSGQSVDQALAILKETTPSVILCDVQMPGTSGFTFYEQICEGRHGDALKSIPFLLMSALVDDFFAKTAKQLGVKQYIPKPFTRELLETTVKEALS